jgi:hypothetical protein
MPDPSPITLTVYRRPGCHLCDDATLLLHEELERRSRAGLARFTIEEVDISTDRELERRYGQRIPVYAIGTEETDLVTTSRQVREFLDRAAGQPA